MFLSANFYILNKFIPGGQDSRWIVTKILMDRIQLMVAESSESFV